jgi:presequence protease
LRLLFDITDIEKELLPYLGILKTVLGYVDTNKHKYGDLFNEINIQTGGISTTMNTYIDSKDLNRYQFKFEIKTKALYENMKHAFSLMEEIMLESKLSDTKRLFEIIQEMKSRMQGDFMSAGHSLAAVRTLSYVSKTALISDSTSGLTLYRLLEDLEENFEKKKEELVSTLEMLVTRIFRNETLMVDYTSDEHGLNKIEEYVLKLKKELYDTTADKTTPTLVPVKKNEAFTNSAQVQYVCRGGNFVSKGLQYTGALRALKVIMSYDYLWNNVRVKGGAYGCMCNFGKSGDSYFVSYRDPNLQKTIEIYEQAASFIESFEADEKGMLKFIIGAVSDLDTPMNPAAKGTRSLMAYLTNQSFEDIQKERDELLGVTVEKIRELSSYIKAFMSDECLCVVGNEEKINEQKHLFEITENLFH